MGGDWCRDRHVSPGPSPLGRAAGTARPPALLPPTGDSGTFVWAPRGVLCPAHPLPVEGSLGLGPRTGTVRPVSPTRVTAALAFFIQVTKIEERDGGQPRGHQRVARRSTCSRPGPGRDTAQGTMTAPPRRPGYGQQPRPAAAWPRWLQRSWGHRAGPLWTSLQPQGRALSHEALTIFTFKSGAFRSGPEVAQGPPRRTGVGSVPLQRRRARGWVCACSHTPAWTDTLQNTAKMSSGVTARPGPVSLWPSDSGHAPAQAHYMHHVVCVPGARGHAGGVQPRGLLGLSLACLRTQTPAGTELPAALTGCRSERPEGVETGEGPQSQGGSPWPPRGHSGSDGDLASHGHLSSRPVDHPPRIPGPEKGHKCSGYACHGACLIPLLSPTEPGTPLLPPGRAGSLPSLFPTARGGLGCRSTVQPFDSITSRPAGRGGAGLL